MRRAQEGTLSGRRAAGLLAALVLLPFLVLVGTAQAATHVVQLTGDGPSPASISIPRGDTVTFRNADNVAHGVRRTSGAWSYDVTIPAGGSATTPPFGSAGTFGYQDRYTVALLTREFPGSITVTAPKPTPTRSATASPKPSPTRSAKPSATRSPTPSPTGSGLAVGPPIGIATIPPVTPTQGPTPDIAPPTSESPTPVAVAYGDKSGLVQSSPHRYGLPMVLALMAALGVLSLIARLLLSLAPSAVPARDPGSAEG